jgi:hypothetical protein
MLELAGGRNCIKIRADPSVFRIRIRIDFGLKKKAKKKKFLAVFMAKIII